MLLLYHMRTTLSHTRQYIKWYVLALLCLISCMLWYVVVTHDNKGILTFAVLDVGQGDALFIESPTGVQVLIDGGPDDKLLLALPHVLPWYDRSIDMIVVTNPDLDHYSGFFSLLNRYSVMTSFEPGTISKTDTYKLLEKQIKNKHIAKVVATRGQRIDLGGGVYLEVLFPDRDVSGLSSNDGSLVMRLVYGETSVILQGDSTIKIEDYLESLDGESLKSTILKVGHHGSRTSTGERYVGAVQPEFAVISSGRDNTYGHPHKETLATLNADNIVTLSTCVMGTIVFHSDGTRFSLQNRQIVPVEAGCRGK